MNFNFIMQKVNFFIEKAKMNCDSESKIIIKTIENNFLQINMSLVDLIEKNKGDKSMRKTELGKQRIKEILGEKSEQIIEMFEAISPDFSNYILDFGYGDLYTRKGFTDKYRELAAVACLIGQGNTGLALKAHLNGMLNVGWTKDEIIELLIFLVAYAGFPPCVEAITTLKQITEEQAEKIEI